MRAGYRDLLCVLILGALALIAPRLEPSYRELWTFLPLVTAIPLLISGILLLFDSRAATMGAMVIHLLMLVTFVLIVSGSLVLLVTILYAGTALVLGGPAALLAINSAATLMQSFRKLRA